MSGWAEGRRRRGPLTDSPHNSRRFVRWIPVAVLALALLVAGYLATRSNPYEYRLLFANAGQLVTGDLVRIGGNEVGTVDDIKLTDDNQAEITVSVTPDYAPLHEGTTATIRQQSLTGVANRYVAISPGSDVRPVIPDGARIGEDDTTPIVDIDQLFNTFDEPSRKGLEQFIQGSADWYEGREANANASAEAFPPALQAMRLLAEEITRDSATFEQFLVQTGDALKPLAERGGEVTELVSNARATARALGSDTDALTYALEQVPGMLRSGSDAFADLRPALRDLRELTDATGPATKDLAPFMRDLQPVLAEAVPTFRQLRKMFAQPGPANDTLDAMRDLPPLAAEITESFPRAREALAESTPVFEFARPYTPDLVSWARNFGSTMAPYDANGHYARTSANFDAFSFIEDANGGHLGPKAPAERGRSPYLTNDNLKRCPGAATLPPADGSAPFVDDGPLANPDCDPADRVGPTG